MFSFQVIRNIIFFFIGFRGLGGWKILDGCAITEGNFYSAYAMRIIEKISEAQFFDVILKYRCFLNVFNGLQVQTRENFSER